MTYRAETDSFSRIHPFEEIMRVIARGEAIITPALINYLRENKWFHQNPKRVLRQISEDAKQRVQEQENIDRFLRLKKAQQKARRKSRNPDVYTWKSAA